MPQQQPATPLTSPSASTIPIAEPVSAAEAPNPVMRPATARRLFLPAAGLGLLVCALLAMALWWHYQTSHVVTRNALVRSHLSELGVRGEGVVSDVYVRAGDRVKKGDLLAQLHNQHLIARREQITATLNTLDQEIMVNAAELAIAQKKAEVSLQVAASKHAQMQAEADAARVQAEDTQAFHAARAQLAPGGAISAEAVRDAAAKAAVMASLASAADAAVASSVSGLEAARLAEEETTLLSGELNVLRARRAELTAQLKRIAADIDGTRVIAPADGAVIRRLAQPGMAVSTGMPLLSLWLTDDTWIEAWIPEERLGDLQVGSKVSVSFPAIPNKKFTGELVRIGLATDFEMPVDYLPQTRETRMRPTPQVGVEIQLDDLPVAIRPGMSAVVDTARAQA